MSKGSRTNLQLYQQSLLLKTSTSEQQIDQTRQQQISETFFNQRQQQENNMINHMNNNLSMSVSIDQNQNKSQAFEAALNDYLLSTSERRHQEMKDAHFAEQQPLNNSQSRQKPRLSPIGGGSLSTTYINGYAPLEGFPSRINNPEGIGSAEATNAAAPHQKQCQELPAFQNNLQAPANYHSQAFSSAASQIIRNLNDSHSIPNGNQSSIMMKSRNNIPVFATVSAADNFLPNSLNRMPFSSSPDAQLRQTLTENNSGKFPQGKVVSSSKQLIYPSGQITAMMIPSLYRNNTEQANPMQTQQKILLNVPKAMGGGGYRISNSVSPVNYQISPQNKVSLPLSPSPQSPTQYISLPNNNMQQIGHFKKDGLALSANALIDRYGKFSNSASCSQMDDGNTDLNFSEKKLSILPERKFHRNAALYLCGNQQSTSNQSPFMENTSAFNISSFNQSSSTFHNVSGSAQSSPQNYVLATTSNKPLNLSKFAKDAPPRWQGGNNNTGGGGGGPKQSMLNILSKTIQRVPPVAAALSQPNLNYLSIVDQQQYSRPHLEQQSNPSLNDVNLALEQQRYRELINQKRQNLFRVREDPFTTQSLLNSSLQSRLDSVGGGSGYSQNFLLTKSLASNSISQNNLSSVQQTSLKAASKPPLGSYSMLLKQQYFNTSQQSKPNQSSLEQMVGGTSHVSSSSGLDQFPSSSLNINQQGSDTTAKPLLNSTYAAQVDDGQNNRRKQLLQTLSYVIAVNNRSRGPTTPVNKSGTVSPVPPLPLFKESLPPQPLQSQAKLNLQSGVNPSMDMTLTPSQVLAHYKQLKLNNSTFLSEQQMSKEKIGQSELASIFINQQVANHQEGRAAVTAQTVANELNGKDDQMLAIADQQEDDLRGQASQLLKIRINQEIKRIIMDRSQNDVKLSSFEAYSPIQKQQSRESNGHHQLIINDKDDDDYGLLNREISKSYQDLRTVPESLVQVRHSNKHREEEAAKGNGVSGLNLDVFQKSLDNMREEIKQMIIETQKIQQEQLENINAKIERKLRKKRGSLMGGTNERYSVSTGGGVLILKKEDIQRIKSNDQQSPRSSVHTDQKKKKGKTHKHKQEAPEGKRGEEKKEKHHETIFKTEKHHRKMHYEESSPEKNDNITDGDNTAKNKKGNSPRFGEQQKSFGGFPRMSNVPPEILDSQNGKRISLARKSIANDQIPRSSLMYQILAASPQNHNDSYKDQRQRISSSKDIGGGGGTSTGKSKRETLNEREKALVDLHGRNMSFINPMIGVQLAGLQAAAAGLSEEQLKEKEREALIIQSKNNQNFTKSITTINYEKMMSELHPRFADTTGGAGGGGGGNSGTIGQLKTQKSRIGLQAQPTFHDFTRRASVLLSQPTLSNGSIHRMETANTLALSLQKQKDELAAKAKLAPPLDERTKKPNKHTLAKNVLMKFGGDPTAKPNNPKTPSKAEQLAMSLKQPLGIGSSIKQQPKLTLMTPAFQHHQSQILLAPPVLNTLAQSLAANSNASPSISNQNQSNTSRSSESQQEARGVEDGENSKNNQSSNHRSSTRGGHRCSSKNNLTNSLAGSSKDLKAAEVQNSASHFGNQKAAVQDTTRETQRLAEKSPLPTHKSHHSKEKPSPRATSPNSVDKQKTPQKHSSKSILPPSGAHPKTESTTSLTRTTTSFNPLPKFGQKETKVPHPPAAAAFKSQKTILATTPPEGRKTYKQMIEMQHKQAADKGSLSARKRKKNAKIMKEIEEEEAREAALKEKKKHKKSITVEPVIKLQMQKTKRFTDSNKLQSKLASTAASSTSISGAAVSTEESQGSIIISTSGKTSGKDLPTVANGGVTTSPYRASIIQEEGTEDDDDSAVHNVYAEVGSSNPTLSHAIDQRTDGSLNEDFDNSVKIPFFKSHIGSNTGYE